MSGELYPGNKDSGKDFWLIVDKELNMSSQCDASVTMANVILGL